MDGTGEQANHSKVAATPATYQSAGRAPPYSHPSATRRHWRPAAADAGPSHAALAPGGINQAQVHWPSPAAKESTASRSQQRRSLVRLLRYPVPTSALSGRSASCSGRRQCPHQEFVVRPVPMAGALEPPFRLPPVVDETQVALVGLRANDRVEPVEVQLDSLN